MNSSIFSLQSYARRNFRMFFAFFEGFSFSNGKVAVKNCRKNFKRTVFQEKMKKNFFMINFWKEMMEKEFWAIFWGETKEKKIFQSNFSRDDEKKIIQRSIFGRRRGRKFFLGNFLTENNKIINSTQFLRRNRKKVSPEQSHYQLHMYYRSRNHRDAIRADN